MASEEGLKAATIAEPLEAVITRIPGVRAARVVLDGARISEIHVIAGTDRSPKQLVRDIQSVAKASLDLELDYRTVSIVQLDEPSEAAESLKPAPRMPLVRVVGTTTGQLAAIEVVLRDENEEIVGRARGAAATTPTLVARATLDAFEPRLGGAVGDVEGIGRMPLAGSEVAVVVVRLVSSTGERLVSGSAIIGADPNDAIARATLAAVNRLPA